MPRDFTTVVDQVVAAIPSGPDTADLLRFLATERADAGYQPPESRRPWERLCALLDNHIGEPTLPWHRRVANIVAGREVTS